MHKVFANFFGGRANHPTFRRKAQNGPFRDPAPLQVRLERDRAFPSNAGWVRLVMHRPIEGKIKNVTVSVSAAAWHVSIQVEQEIADPAPNHGPAIGIDLGGELPILLSDERSSPCRTWRKPAIDSSWLP